MGLKICPGDLLIVRYKDLDDATAAYQVVAVYDVEWKDSEDHQRFYYFHLGQYRLYDAPVSVLEEKSIEVTVHR